tara:strand:- start:381 stop:1196 length:816 start_codon:yes stop_codon:yes gene_type:complete
MMSGGIKFVGQRIPVFEILFIRQIGALLIISPILLRQPIKTFKTKFLKLHLARGACAAIAMMTGFTALVHLPLAEVTAIHFTQTLFTTLLAIIFLNETVGIRRWTVTIVGFFGVLVIIRPTTDGMNEFALLALISALFVAGVIIIIRRLSRTEAPATIMAHLSLFVTIVMAGPAFYVWVMPTLVELAIILLFGISMSAIEWLRIEGMREAEAAVVAPFEYTRLLFATIIGVLVFSEIPTIWTLVGSTIIIGSTLYTIRRNTLQAMSQDSRP